MLSVSWAVATPPPCQLSSLRVSRFASTRFCRNGLVGSGGASARLLAPPAAEEAGDATSRPWTEDRRTLLGGRQVAYLLRGDRERHRALGRASDLRSVD